MNTENEYTWLDYTRDIDNLRNSIDSRKEEISVVVGISPHGIIPANEIASSFDLTLVIIDPENSTDIKWLEGQVRKTVVIDMISDTGTFLNNLKAENPNILSAVVIQKEFADWEPDFYGSMNSGTEWITFPWNRKV